VRCSRSASTLITATNCFVLFTCQLRVTHAVRDVSRLRVIRIGAGFLVAALACMAAAMLSPGPAGAWIVVFGIVIYSVGEMLVLPSTYAIVSSISS
jgi:hypothetical protein